MQPSETLVYWLALGANLGHPESAFVRALRKLEQHQCRVMECSSLYETAPQGPVEQADFLNAVVRLQTVLHAEALLVLLKDLEAEAGRRKGIRWGPRPLDLDLLLVADAAGRMLKVETPTLSIPHPRLQDRAFVLLPLLELAPELRLPGASQLLAERVGDDTIRRQVIHKLCRNESWYPLPYAPSP